MIGDIFRGINKKSVFRILAFSQFVDAIGPTPKYCYPTVSQEDQTRIAMKSISLLMGEGVYQSGYEVDGLKYFGILPFPDINMVGLTYFFLIKDEKARGKAKAATISVLVDEKNSPFLYENIKTLRILLDKTCQKLNDGNTSDIEIKKIMDILREELEAFDSTDGSIRRLTKKIKVVFAGLDKSGKTSFLKSIKNKYSELMGITPTKGIERSESNLLGTTLLEWDMGGQSNYRTNYFKNAELYLSDIDLLFYLFDVQDEERIEENYSYLNQILNTLDGFKQYPPITIIFHKSDPDIAKNRAINNRITSIIRYIEENHKNWTLRFFKTTIFDHWSIISAFSFAISHLSPNRELFRKHLKWITKKMDGNASIFLTQNAIILSDYSENWITGKFFELSQSNFYNLFLKFEEFQLLKSDYIQWEFGEYFKILFKKIIIDEKEFYLLLQIKNDEKLNDLDGYISSFKKKIQPIIKNYLLKRSRSLGR